MQLIFVSASFYVRHPVNCNLTRVVPAGSLSTPTQHCSPASCDGQNRGISGGICGELAGRCQSRQAGAPHKH